MEGEVKGKTYKMKGHTLPGINQRLDAKATNVAEQGLAGSSAFQQFAGVGAALTRGAGSVFGGGGSTAAAQAMQQANPLPNVPPPIMSKPSIAKIYDKPKGKRTKY